jgi:hypothetical protein
MQQRRLTARELKIEGTAGALFLCAAVPMAIHGLSSSPEPLDIGLATALVLLYALASRVLELPLGAGYAVPTYVVLVPMLLLLGPGVTPLLAAAGLALASASTARCCRCPTHGTRSDRPRSCCSAARPTAGPRRPSSTCSRSWRDACSRCSPRPSASRRSSEAAARGSNFA